MANKFGKGYYNDWESMLIGLQVGLQEAFKMACERLCEECNERIRGGIYGNLHDGSYDDFRTYELADIEYLIPNIIGFNCYFSFDDKNFISLTKSNPEHHALTDDVGNGYGAESFMIEIISPNHNQFMDDIRDYIQKEFANIYRNCCRELKIQLN